MKNLPIILCAIGALLSAFNNEIIVVVFGWCLMWSGYCLGGNAGGFRIVLAIISSILLAETSASAIIEHESDLITAISASNMAVIGILLPFALMCNARLVDIITLLPAIALSRYFEPLLITKLVIAMAFIFAAAKSLLSPHHRAATGLLQMAVLILWLNPEMPYYQLSMAAIVLCSARLMWLFYSPPCEGHARHISSALAIAALLAAYYAANMPADTAHLIIFAQIIAGSVLASLFFWGWMDNRDVSEGYDNHGQWFNIIAYPAWLAEKIEDFAATIAARIAGYSNSYIFAPAARATSSNAGVGIMVGSVTITIAALIIFSRL